MVNEKEYMNLDVVDVHNSVTQILRYNSFVEEELSDLGKKGYPNEICGFLLGEIAEFETVTRVIEVENRAVEKERKFEINPLDYVRVEQLALDLGLDVIGVYHSHPNYPAIPSAHDLKFAQKEFSYVIISVDGNGLVLITSWKNINKKFRNQKIKIN